MKKILFLLIIWCSLLSINASAQNWFDESEYTELENYAWVLSLEHGYELINIDENTVEYFYKWESIWTENDKEFLHTSFTFSTNKGDYLINHSQIYLNWDFLNTIEDSPILFYENSYLGTPNWVFKLISQSYWDRTNKRKIVLKMPKADPSSFKVWWDKTSSDNYHVYHETEVVTGLEWSSFESLARNYFKSNWVLYEWTPRNSEENFILDGFTEEFFEKVESINPGNFEVVDDYFTKNSTWIYHKEKKVEWIDPWTFIPLWKNYYKDKNWAYVSFSENWEWSPLPKISSDSLSFEVITPEIDSEFWEVMGFAKDSNSIHFMWEVISEDVDWFVAMTNLVWKDSSKVYCLWSWNNNIDVETFKLIQAKQPEKLDSEPIHFKDKNHVYQLNFTFNTSQSYCTQVWEFDWSTFVQLNSRYYTDKSWVYYTSSWFNKVRKVQADLDTFELIQDDNLVLSAWFAKDKDTLYFIWLPIPKGTFNKDTFKVIWVDTYQDKNWIYEWNISWISGSDELIIDVKEVIQIDSADSILDAQTILDM